MQFCKLVYRIFKLSNYFSLRSVSLQVAQTPTRSKTLPLKLQLIDNNRKNDTPPPPPNTFIYRKNSRLTSKPSAGATARTGAVVLCSGGGSGGSGTDISATMLSLSAAASWFSLRKSVWPDGFSSLFLVFWTFWIFSLLVYNLIVSHQLLSSFLLPGSRPQQSPRCCWSPCTVSPPDEWGGGGLRGLGGEDLHKC